MSVEIRRYFFEKTLRAPGSRQLALHFLMLGLSYLVKVNIQIYRYDEPFM